MPITLNSAAHNASSPQKMPVNSAAIFRVMMLFQAKSNRSA